MEPPFFLFCCLHVFRHAETRPSFCCWFDCWLPVSTDNRSLFAGIDKLATVCVWRPVKGGGHLGGWGWGAIVQAVPILQVRFQRQAGDNDVIDYLPCPWSQPVSPALYLPSARQASHQGALTIDRFTTASGTIITHTPQLDVAVLFGRTHQQPTTSPHPCHQQSISLW